MLWSHIVACWLAGHDSGSHHSSQKQETCLHIGRSQKSSPCIFYLFFILSDFSWHQPPILTPSLTGLTSLLCANVSCQTYTCLDFCCSIFATPFFHFNIKQSGIGGLKCIILETRYTDINLLLRFQKRLYHFQGMSHPIT